MWIDDKILERCGEDLVAEAWVPNEIRVVCGASNDFSREVDLSRCANDGVPVTRRYGGGGAVVLFPGCVVVSVGIWVSNPYRNQHYFSLLNRAVIDSLACKIPPQFCLSDAGISDIVCGDRKVAGTSLFRSRHYLLYQASILVRCDRAIIAQYLLHPSREPDYRRGRNHEDFMMGLDEVAPQITPQGVANELHRSLRDCLTARLGAELIPAQRDQLANLLARADAGNKSH